MLSSKLCNGCRTCFDLEKREKLGVLFTFWWMVWKERNRRIFDGRILLCSALGCRMNGSVSVSDA
jgi:hypothetical protein